MPEILIISALFPTEPVVSALLSKDIADEIANKYKVGVLCPKPTRPEGGFFEEKFDTERYQVVRLNSFTSPASKLFGRFKESYSFGIHAVEYVKKKSKEIDCIYINSCPFVIAIWDFKNGKKVRYTVYHSHPGYLSRIVIK